MNTLWQDALYGARMLAKRPGVTAIAVMSLALGIGLNTTIFTLVNSVLLASLPFSTPDRLVFVWTTPPDHPDQNTGANVPDFFNWKERQRSFESFAAIYGTFSDFGNEANGMAAEQIHGQGGTPELLRALGIQPLLGRYFTDAEDEIDNPASVVLLSHRLWLRRFNADPSVLGKTIRMDGRVTTIIGVLRPEFQLFDPEAEYLAPIRFNRFQMQGGARFMATVGRLKPGVSLQQAQADMSSVAAGLTKEFPALYLTGGKPLGIRVQSMRDGLVGWIAQPLLLLQGAVGFVLLIACANVAGLLLARASSRHQEVAIRSALGAGRARIVRQFLTESVLLAVVGGVFGILLAWWGVQALVAMAPPWFPRVRDTAIDGRVLAFCAALSVVTGLIFGVMPALQGSKPNFNESLKDAVRGGTGGGARQRMRGALVTIQIALALVLLIGAGLLVRSFVRLQQTNLNSDPTGVLTFQVRFPVQQFGKVQGTYRGLPLWELSPVPALTLNQMYERLKGISGIVSAAGLATPPLSGAAGASFTIDGRPPASTPADTPNGLYYPATPNYFKTMKIAMVRGRDFTDRDTATAPWVAIVSETMARRFWPDEDAIGKRLTIGLVADEQSREIVGVVRDTPAYLQQPRQDPQLYVPLAQSPPHATGPYANLRTQLTFVARTAGDPMSVVPAVQRAMAEVDPNRPLANIRTVEQYLGQQVEYPRYYSMLLTLFALVATLLAAVGIYGVMAYAVAQRTREIGIRMALGAGRWQVFSLVLRQAAILVGVGVLLGVLGSFSLTRYISSQLWQVTATDPITFLAVSLLLIAVAFVACLIPTHRAVKVDPMVALRHE